MKLYEYARKVNKVLKEKKKEEAGRYLSPVRRLERFAPVTGDRIVAMTFDDGPMNMPPEPVNEKFAARESLTALLLEIMKAYGAAGTFDVIGSTKENYPDEAGPVHSTRWGRYPARPLPPVRGGRPGRCGQPARADRRDT